MPFGRRLTHVMRRSGTKRMLATRVAKRRQKAVGLVRSGLLNRPISIRTRQGTCFLNGLGIASVMISRPPMMGVPEYSQTNFEKCPMIAGSIKQMSNTCQLFFLVLC